MYPRLLQSPLHYVRVTWIHPQSCALLVLEPGVPNSAFGENQCLVWWCRYRAGWARPRVWVFPDRRERETAFSNWGARHWQGLLSPSSTRPRTATVPVPDRLKCHVRESAIMHSASLRRHTYRILDCFVGNIGNEWHAANCLHSG
jgi:hypothetical protein